jgi:hypothetical protein
VRAPAWVVPAIAAAAATAIAIAIRVSGIGQWPTGFRPTLEFDSANAARTIWFALNSSHLLAWQEAWLEARPGRFIEPPILQTLTALTYLPDGVERPWTSALFAGSFWLVAGAFLFGLCRRLTGWWGATFALGYFLLAPFALAVSQSFQPEPVLVMGLVIAIWFVARRDILRSWRSVVATAIVLGLATLTKPGVLFPILGALCVASATGVGTRYSRRRGAMLLALLILVALPAGVYAAVLLPEQLQDKILPGLLLTPGFYAGWALNVIRVVGIFPLLAGAVGFIVVPRLRRIGVGLLGGYLLYTLTFSWHSMTHDYYQVPLLVIMSIGIAGSGEALASWVQTLRRRAALVVVGALLAGGALTYGTSPADLWLPNRGNYPNAARFDEIGRMLGAGEPVVAFTEWYGKPLMFYSRLLVVPWPDYHQKDYEATLGIRLSDTERLRALVDRHQPGYFVVTAPADWNQDLVDFLAARYPLARQGDRLLVFDLDPG